MTCSIPLRRLVAITAAVALGLFAGCGDDQPAGDNDDELRTTNDGEADAGPDDAGPTDPCDDVDCPGDQPCHPDTGDCVECLEDTDCPDGDCDTDEHACVQTGPQFSDEQVPTDDVDGFSSASFDLAVDDQGRPTVAILDPDDATAAVVRRDDAWTTAATLDLSSYDFAERAQLRMDIDQEGRIHLLATATDDLVYAAGDETGFDDESIYSLTGEPGHFRSTAVTVDHTGSVHKLGGQTTETDGAFFYRRLDPEGTSRAVDGHVLSFTDETIRHVDLDIRSDGLPTMMMTMETDDPQLVAPDDLDDQNWPGGDIGASSDYFVPVVVKADDEPRVVVHTPEKGAGLEFWAFDGATAADSDQWQIDPIATDSHSPWLVVDDGRPHLSFVHDQRLSWATREQGEWLTHQLADELAGDDGSRIAVDDGVPHIVGHTAGDRLEYFVLE